MPHPAQYIKPVEGVGDTEHQTMGQHLGRPRYIYDPVRTAKFKKEFWEGIAKQQASKPPAESIEELRARAAQIDEDELEPISYPLSPEEFQKRLKAVRAAAIKKMSPLEKAKMRRMQRDQDMRIEQIRKNDKLRVEINNIIKNEIKNDKHYEAFSGAIKGTKKVLLEWAQDEGFESDDQRREIAWEYLKEKHPNLSEELKRAILLEIFVR